jgi:thioredoxin reductase
MLSNRHGVRHGRSMTDFEVAVIGGGAAGLSAGIALARFRKRVVVVDAGEPRNAPADGVHNLLGREGVAPAELLAAGRADLARYGGELLAGRVVDATGERGGFRLTLGDGATVTAGRVVVTTGLVDELPDVPGLAEGWGHTVVHCPFCHGWEVRDGRIGVLATAPDAAVHQAHLFRQLSADVTVLANGLDLPTDRRAELAAVGVEVVDAAVAAVGPVDGAPTGVRLASGAELALDAIAVAPRFRARAAFLAPLGLDVVQHPSGMGEHVPCGMGGATSVPGVWVAGNVTDPMAQVSAAAAAGTMAGAMAIADLVAEQLAVASP